MRYIAQRVGTLAWMDRDLPLTGVERTRVLSGPGGITATISPELRNQFHTDGLRIIERWGTFIFGLDDNEDPVIGGIVSDIEADENGIKVTCIGFSGYADGYIYGNDRYWGTEDDPQVDPLVVVADLWNYIQAEQASNLNLVLEGAKASPVRIGTFENRYKLESFTVPNIGSEIEALAQSTPFDFYTGHRWSNAERTVMGNYLTIGYPRTGQMRRDLRFALGENIVETIPVTSKGDAFANDVWGIGNGEGVTLIRSRSTRVDGRLRRTAVVTDKTAGQNTLDYKVLRYAERVDDTVDLTSLRVMDDENARLSTINLGDDIYVQTEIAAYGVVELWVRVIGITESDDDPDRANLAVARSTLFSYSATESYA